MERADILKKANRILALVRSTILNFHRPNDLWCKNKSEAQILNNTLFLVRIHVRLVNVFGEGNKGRFFTPEGYRHLNRFEELITTYIHKCNITSGSIDQYRSKISVMMAYLFDDDDAEYGINTADQKMAYLNSLLAEAENRKAIEEPDDIVTSVVRKEEDIVLHFTSSKMANQITLSNVEAKALLQRLRAQLPEYS